jgi:hypothetical protein
MPKVDLNIALLAAIHLQGGSITIERFQSLFREESRQTGAPPADTIDYLERAGLIESAEGRIVLTSVGLWVRRSMARAALTMGT